MIGTRPVVMLLSEGQMSDYKGARLIVNDLPLAKHLLADRGYDADWFREALESKGIKPCIPLKDWRRVATRYDRCTHTFFSAICIAAIVIFYLDNES